MKLNKKIGIIGSGNMGSAIAQGIIKKNLIEPSNLYISSPNIDKLNDLKNVGVQLFTENTKVAEKSDIIIIAVKPQIAPLVLTEIKHAIQKKHLIISIMAGFTTASIESHLKTQTAVIRAMPNLCASVGGSMTGWYKNTFVSAEQANICKQIFTSFGTEVEVTEEEQLNAITAISGSGPAYFFYIAKLLIEAGQNLGLPEKTSIKLVKQTIYGSSKILNASQESAQELQKRVTSKGGTTEAAFNILYKENIARIIIEAVKAAQKRATELNR